MSEQTCQHSKGVEVWPFTMSHIPPEVLGRCRGGCYQRLVFSVVPKERIADLETQVARLTADRNSLAQFGNEVEDALDGRQPEGGIWTCYAPVRIDTLKAQLKAATTVLAEVAADDDPQDGCAHSNSAKAVLAALTSEATASEEA